MYSAFKEFYNLLSQVDSVYHDAALKLGLTDSELDILYSLNEHGSGCNQSIFLQRDRHHKIHDQLCSTQDGTGRLSVPETWNREEHLRFFSRKKGEELMKNTAHRLIAIENAIF